MMLKSAAQDNIIESSKKPLFISYFVSKKFIFELIIRKKIVVCQKKAVCVIIILIWNAKNEIKIKTFYKRIT